MKPLVALVGWLLFLPAAYAAPNTLPIALSCSAAVVIHSNMFPETEVSREQLAHMNRCLLSVQTYAKAHCPETKLPIWAQVEAVASSGTPDDKRALIAACP